MTAPVPPWIKTTTTAIRGLLVVASILVATIGISLNLLPEHTDRFFAWTIGAPLTAAFLGAGYWAAVLLEYRASRQHVWARARIAVPAVLLFTTLTLVATLLHLDAFHFDAPRLVTRVGTWGWMGVYALVPVAMLVLWVGQIREPGSDPPRLAPLPRAIRILLVVQAVILLLLGAALLMVPSVTGPWWPWELTPLTARAVGAWLLGMGTLTGHAAWENDWVRLEPMMLAALVFAVIQFVALGRFPDAVDWQAPAAWLYVTFQVSVLGLGAYGWPRSRRAVAANPPAAPPDGIATSPDGTSGAEPPTRRP